MTDNIQKARDLFFNSGKTQKEIAAQLGVSERTINNWIRQHNWRELREASYHMPALIADNLCRHIVNLQNDIDQREPGKQFPTLQEAEIIKRMIMSMDKMKKYPTPAMYRQMFETFNDYLEPADPVLAAKLSWRADWFLESDMHSGFRRSDMEYGVPQAPPAAPETGTEETRPEPQKEPETPGNTTGKNEPETAPGKTTEQVEYQHTYEPETHFPVPEKTGNFPETDLLSLAAKYPELLSPCGIESQPAETTPCKPTTKVWVPLPGSPQPLPPNGQTPSKAQLKDLTDFLRRTA